MTISSLLSILFHIIYKCKSRDTRITGLIGIYSICVSFILYNFQPSILFNLKTSFLGRKVYTFLNKKWFFDKLYSELIGQFFFKFGYTVSYKSVDRGAFEIMGPAGLSSVASSVARKLHKAQTGSLYHYTLFSSTYQAAAFMVKTIVLTKESIHFKFRS